MNNNCAARACIVEQSFISSIFEIFFSGTPINVNFKHDNGFDSDVECPLKQCNGQGCNSARECCGVYPNRAFYRTYGGERQCCGGKVYDSNILDCCENTEIKLVGSC